MVEAGQSDIDRCDIPGSKDQSGISIGLCISLCQNRQSGVTLNPQAGDARDPGGQAKQSRTRPRSSLNNSRPGLSGDAGGQQHRLDSTAIAGKRLGVTHPAAEQVSS